MHRPPILLAFALLCPAAPGCSPDTGLFDEGRAPRRARTDAAPTAAADAGASAADEPPVLSQVSIVASGGCLRLRAESSKAVDASVTLRTADASEERELGRGASLFDVAFTPTRLPAGAEASAEVVAVDGEGRRVVSEPAPFRVPALPALPLVITEVLPNPAGPETSQEYVEILNRGALPAPLAGLFIEDEGGRDPLPATVLAPGVRALVVAAGFDPSSAADAAPGPDTPLVRVMGRLGRDGLRQAGEAVRLVSADGAVLSSYGGWVDTTRGAWQGKSIHRQPDEAACDHPQSWSMAPLPPTPGQ